MGTNDILDSGSDILSSISDPVIAATNISKSYRLYKSTSDRFKEALDPFKRKKNKDFYALKKVSFSIQRGETIGIVGKNGSGKSTLLKILSRVATATEGTIQVKGKIAALLELGTGFNPEFTGLENIFFSGAIMGFSKKEIEEKKDEILDFADIGEFINQPVKTYSSGMFSRLAFALAINVEPEILIVDEVLSVGDVAFQRKCYARMDKFRQSGKTILIVSHSPAVIIELCDRAFLLDNGEKILEGDPKPVTDNYLKLLNMPADKVTSFRNRLIKIGCLFGNGDDINHAVEQDEEDNEDGLSPLLDRNNLKLESFVCSTSPACFSIDKINNVVVSTNECDETLIVPCVMGKPLEIEGWAVDPDTQHCAGKVVLKLNGSFYGAAYGIQRCDVGEALQNHVYDNSGFKATIPTDNLQRGMQSLSIIVFSTDESSFYCSEKDIKFEVKETIDGDFHVSHMKPLSTVFYETRGALISKITMTTLDGRRVNHLLHNHRYKYSYEVEILDDLYRVSFGMMIKTLTGYEICGGSYPGYKKSTLSFKKGAFIKMSWDFLCLLEEGTYLTNCGVQCEKNGEEIYAARTIDAYIFNVLYREDRITTAVVDFDLKPKLEI